ncbi:sulfatase family protein [Puniceicoccus vermicola]|uniref:Sulfatase-like hydrolase/transferase n=1 Tax=Puniceicoccus vermicola TaxID=388746 RepID=A0A7X1E5N7_9BACT|nr:sulfatase-like hydrolase/transferase [Puniceicoccus vermicola]MBC2603243.1 sulfatase-like hydrolase/transferase [Puniceicoccus vermicola]
MNVLHILSDQHQAACMGHAGHPQAITPHLDRLASQGVSFSSAYTQNPICTPSRVSMLSGQYCHNHGYYGLGGPRPERLPNYLGHFRRHGYRTAGIGKLHLPDQPHNWVVDDVDLLAECYESASNNKSGANSYRSPYFEYLEALGLREQEDSIRLPEFPGKQQHEARPSLLPYKHSVEGWCVQTARRFISDSGDQPWCVQVSLPRPHQCYTPDQEFWDRYPEDLDLPVGLHQDAAHRPPHFQKMVERYRNGHGLLKPDDFESWARRVWRGYLACVTQVDHAVGELMDFLETHGLTENTIVVYGSDHGAYSGTFGVPEKAPGICSEKVCRVPMVWRVPGISPSEHRCDLLAENIDFAPTFTTLCGLPPMETSDGCDLSALLRGENNPVREVAVTENVWSKSLRYKNWRYVHYQPETFGGKEAGELYDLEADPGETRNLYFEADYAPVLHQCRRLLLEWLIRTTRATTIWPATGSKEQPLAYATADDGKESNAHGAVLRARNRQLNYL